MTTAIYLAHLNPVTNAHVEIIKELKNQTDVVKVMPVIFLKGDKEINSRSFPFNFEIRRKMLESVFGDSILVSRNYTFHAPFSKYFPPILSSLSWKLKNQILEGVEGGYFTYTGNRTEGLMLWVYGLHPKVGARKQVSATSVKNKLYDAAMDIESDWKKDVPKPIESIILANWSILEKYSRMPDQTTRVLGMKFPKEGYSSN